MIEKKHEQHNPLRRVLDKAQEVAGAVAGRVNVARVESAKSFVEQVAHADRYEIEAAKLALKRASSDEVRTIAQKMLDDHQTSEHQLQAALEMNETRDVVGRPQELDARRKAMLNHLRTAPTDAFETMYIDQQVLAHDEAYHLLTHYQERGDNPQLRSYAAGTAPVVERHLRRAKALRAQLAH